MNSLPKKNVDKPYTDPKTGKFIEGNPGGGRPKGSGISITTEIKRKLEEVPEGKEKTYLHYLINKIMEKALKDGDTKMLDRIWAYVDGMPKQSIDHGLDDNVEEIEITIKKNRDEVETGDN